MDLTIQKAKNGEETVSVDGHFLHSNYAPRKEAERFVENLQLPYTPSLIILTEPGISFAAEFLRQKFPDIKTGVIRYIKGFEKYNSKFDFVINYFEHTDFEAYLENRFTEEELLTTVFISWPASAQIFKNQEEIVWNAIKASMMRSKTLLITRQYFEKKWFLNSCNFLKYLKNVITLKKQIAKDVLIISSGPSLLPYLKTIKENQNKFFIICLSSAISAAVHNNIIPDLCMSTDGGYWAGEHLKALKDYSIPTAMPAEAYCHKELFSKLKLLVLDYGDGLSSELLKLSDIPVQKAVRNGTVSGTALLFACQYFTKNIYLCGLDLASQKGYQHTQPNQLEINAEVFDNRLITKAQRLTRSELNSSSLDIYRDWFINNPLDLKNRKVYRLVENSKNSLGWIEDLNKNSFEKQLALLSDSNKDYFENINLKKNLKSCSTIFTDNNDKWKHQLFPLDYVLHSHNPDNNEIINKINNSWLKLKMQAERIFDDNI